jgi:hypothetical protein
LQLGVELEVLLLLEVEEPVAQLQLHRQSLRADRFQSRLDLVETEVPLCQDPVMAVQEEQQPSMD